MTKKFLISFIYIILNQLINDVYILLFHDIPFINDDEYEKDFKISSNHIQSQRGKLIMFMKDDCELVFSKNDRCEID